MVEVKETKNSQAIRKQMLRVQVLYSILQEDYRSNLKDNIEEWKYPNKEQIKRDVVSLRQELLKLSKLVESDDSYGSWL